MEMLQQNKVFGISVGFIEHSIDSQALSIYSPLDLLHEKSPAFAIETARLRN